MKTRIAAAVIVSLLAGSLGTAYAQGAQMTSQPSPATTSASMNGSEQSSQNNNMSSDRIEQKIKHALTSHGVTATDVNVTFNDGTATLSGTVYNQRDISKAKKAAMHVRGVKHVDTSDLHARGSKANQTQS